MREIENCRTLCDYYNEIVYEVGKLSEMCGNTNKALKIRDYIYDMLTVKLFEPLYDVSDLQEEELGCSFEVIAKLREANYIYRDDGVAFGFIGINFNDEDKLMLYNDDECNIFTSDLRLADYKKTWFLRKDKEE